MKCGVLRLGKNLRSTTLFCVTLDKLLKLSGSRFPHLYLRVQ